MRKIKFCFVILNYNTYSFTIECINSIFEKCSNNDYKIIIVDNQSPDKSGEKLKDYYLNNEYVDVLINDTNSGFASGNNIGIKFARENYNPSFIIVNNSDTLILQDDFLDNISRTYKKYKFAILGPKVIIPEKKLQYIPQKLITIRQVKHTIISYYFRLFLNVIGLTKLESKKFNTIVKIKINDPNSDKIYTNVVIHGCFFILSEEYFNYFDIIPEDSKFYREEEFLYLNCKKENLLTLYNPEIEVFHNVNGSVKSSYSSLRKRNIFKYKKHIKANKILYKKMKEIKKNEI